MPLPKDLRLGVDVASRRPLRDETYTTLRRAILSGVFAPGDRLVQHDVAARLGLSRSPVREALQRLEQEGLVQSTRRGLVVRGLDPSEVEELYRIRANLEAYAVRLAARKFRPEHLPLFQAIFATGAGISNTHLGQANIALLTMDELVRTVSRIGDVTGIPLIVDAGTGFGGYLNLQRTVRELERAGAAAITLEDQVFPKRCGHSFGKRVAPAARWWRACRQPWMPGETGASSSWRAPAPAPTRELRAS